VVMIWPTLQPTCLHEPDRAARESCVENFLGYYSKQMGWVLSKLEPYPMDGPALTDYVEQ
jgi:hypothetical protein